MYAPRRPCRRHASTHRGDRLLKIAPNALSARQVEYIKADAIRPGFVLSLLVIHPKDPFTLAWFHAETVNWPVVATLKSELSGISIIVVDTVENQYSVYVLHAYSLCALPDRERQDIRSDPETKFIFTGNLDPSSVL